MPIATAEERIGTVLAGRYTLVEILGEGGMGTVFRGTHRWTGRSVAIKLVRPGLEHTDASQRLRREARASSQLAHPASVEVLDLDVDADGTIFLVFELLEGRSLRDHLETERSPEHVLTLLLPILGALGRAHDCAVVHRDLKPDNIFVVEDALGRQIAKLMDFGIAKAEDSLKTTEGAILGTPSYMAPEQFEGSASVGDWTDVWAMGVILYEALSGKRPFQGKNLSEVAARIMLSPFVPLGDVADVGPGVAGAVREAMRRAPGARPKSMREFARLLIAGAATDGLSLSPEVQRLALPPHVRGGELESESDAEMVPAALPVMPSDSPPKKSRAWVLGALGLAFGALGGGVLVGALAPSESALIESAPARVTGSEEPVETMAVVPQPESRNEALAPIAPELTPEMAAEAAAELAAAAEPPASDPQDSVPSDMSPRTPRSTRESAPRTASRPTMRRTPAPPAMTIRTPEETRPAIHREFE